MEGPYGYIKTCQALDQVDFHHIHPPHVIFPPHPYPNTFSNSELCRITKLLASLIQKWGPPSIIHSQNASSYKDLSVWIHKLLKQKNLGTHCSRIIPFLKFLMGKWWPAKGISTIGAGLSLWMILITNACGPQGSSFMILLFLCAGRLGVLSLMFDGVYAVCYAKEEK